MKGYIRRNDRGVVSLMVTVIMMLIISMIVLGFATISRREQRQSLDRQLSTQAFLAAESGINDARVKIQDALVHGLPITEKKVCDQGDQGPGATFEGLPFDGTSKVYDVDLANNVSYSCILVNTTLSNIHQVVTKDGPSAIIPIHASGTGKLQTLHIKWGLTDKTSPVVTGCAANLPASPVPLPQSGKWGPNCSFGILRIDMVPTDSVKRTDLMNKQRSFFLYPVQGGPAEPITDYRTAKGSVTALKCGPTGCSAQINSIDLAGAATSTNDQYSLRLSSVYADGVVDITAQSSDGSTMQLKDSQAEIDVTGRAQDVLRRIQVRMSLALSNQAPGSALQSGSSICKRFALSGTQYTQGDIMVAM